MSPRFAIQKISTVLPRLGLSALIICLVSGIILSLYYRPEGNVFQNVEELTSLVPYGKFFRQLHYGAGQAFVFLMLLHTVDHFLKRRYQAYSQAGWASLILSLCLCFLALFTGFVLKGDKEGFFAGQILMNILRAVPFIGEPLARLVIEPGKHFFFLPYLYHILFVPVILIYLIRDHIREWFPDQKFFLLASIGLFSYAIFVDPYTDVPPDAPVDLVRGPWFFLGIQTLLRIIPPLWAGLIIPCGFLACVTVLPSVGRPWQTLLHYSTVGCFLAYGLLTLRAAFLAP